MKTEDMKKIIKALENPGIPVEGYHFKNHEWIQTAEIDLHRFNDFRIKPPNIVPDGYEWTGEVRPPVKGEESIIIGTVNSPQFSVSSDHLYFNWGDCQGCRYILKRSTANPGQAISNECQNQDSKRPGRIKNDTMECLKCGFEAPEMEWDRVWSCRQGGFVDMSCPSCKTVGHSRYTGPHDTSGIVLHGIDLVKHTMKPIVPQQSTEFKECSICAAKPGIPELCPSCLHNRAAIAELKKKVSRS